MLFVVVCSVPYMFAVYVLLIAVCCLLNAACESVVCCSLFVVCWLLLSLVYCRLLLFVVCCCVLCVVVCCGFGCYVMLIDVLSC